MAEFADTYGNKLWRLTHLYKIRDKKRRLRLFTVNDIQAGIVKFLDDHFIKPSLPLRAFFLKYRQGGVSTLLLLWWLDDAVFNPNTVCGVLSHERDSLRQLANIIKTGFINLPEALKPPLEVDNTDELAFGHGTVKNGHYSEASRIFISLNIRSTPVHNLHISEHAHCDQADIAASVGAVPPDGGITAETTANGMNHSYEVYTEGKLLVKTGAVPEPGVLKATFFPWYIQREYRLPVPAGMVVTRTSEENRVAARALSEYGIKLDDEQILYRRKLAKDTKGLRPQEFPENDDEAFLSSGNKFFNGLKIVALMAEAKEILKKTPPFEETDDYIMFEEPQERDVYLAAADVSEGIGQDFSTISILNLTRRRQAFRYKAMVSVGNFYRECDKWGRLYNNALFAPEKNNHGHAVILGLTEYCKYPRLWSPPEAEDTRVRVVTSANPARKEREYGWKTTPQNRTPTLDALKLAVEGEIDEDVEHFRPAWRILDTEFLRECLNFTELDGKFQAAPGYHDDLVMANAIVNQLFMRAPRARTDAAKSPKGPTVWSAGRREQEF